MGDHLDEDTEDLLTTIEQVEETLSIMTSVVEHLKDQLLCQMGLVDSREMTAEEFLEYCENSEGIVH